MKLLIAIPSYETMRVEFVTSLMGLTRRLTADGVDYDVEIKAGTLVHVARDALARHAMNNGYSHILWLDSDMVFEPSILEDLMISGHQDEMVCGLFISRHSPYLSCLFSSLTPVERMTELPQDTMQVAACGFGCVLMNAQIIPDILNRPGAGIFIPTVKLGEDVAFCKRATDAGYRIWCEPSARVGHIASVPVWPEDAERLRGEIHGLDGKKLN